MSKQYDFKKEWPRLKKELVRVSQEALDLAKKGEKQIVKLSKQGKLHIDVSALKLKKERLYYQVGREYVIAKCPEAPTAKIKKLVTEVDKADKEMSVLNKKIKAQAAKKKAPAKKKTAQSKRK